MLKVGDRVKFKKETVQHLFGIDNGKVIEIADLIYKIESKLGDNFNFIHDTIIIYKLRNELYKIVTIFAGIF